MFASMMRDSNVSKYVVNGSSQLKIVSCGYGRKWRIYFPQGSSSLNDPYNRDLVFAPYLILISKVKVLRVID